ncbi:MULTISPECIES: sporulation-specific diadenylate cyclase CdaS [Bacillaceae]|uniref:sporulation-specific diadenylate cyclase CdaS n=1 Tax=Bacillaceae TaxID=186817 RepID=UPI001BDF1D62|nr:MULTISPECIES: sporulation-specific diadenylate cyclase CdaS [Bacillaceae]MDX8360972.1 sporulation-specific diadenylate cyclase CdaS [Cytobacillus sp. IB215316]MDX8363595.1 sporulation-specific diadenylate cyclase CdaS [Cytobacillus sp. IB215665]
MKNVECDFSPMKQQLKADMKQVITNLEESLQSIDDDKKCLLGELEDIKKSFVQIEMNAASFYLNCYLSSYTDKYEDISLSIQHMSDRRHGGLIVVQRQDPLSSYIQSNIPIEAQLTSSLLESIFFPGNPLHDGAVIIHGNQIVSAANVLPLSNHYIGKSKLGTRHRAALGLTERCDALVLIVSEESGNISFTIGGHLYPIANAKSL